MYFYYSWGLVIWKACKSLCSTKYQKC